MMRIDNLSLVCEKYQLNALITFQVTTDVHDFLGQPSYYNNTNTKWLIFIFGLLYQYDLAIIFQLIDSRNWLIRGFLTFNVSNTWYNYDSLENLHVLWKL